MSVENKVPRRVVTGHDASGRAIILEDCPTPRIIQNGPVMPVIFELWNTRETPVRVARQMREPKEETTLPPPPNGTRARIIDFPPEGEGFDAAAKANFKAMGGASEALDDTGSAPHALMHRTESVDVALVLDGEIALIVDKGETLVRAGDVIIQCGTNHSWANRSGKNCRMAFFMINGKFERDIA